MSYLKDAIGRVKIVEYTPTGARIVWARDFCYLPHLDRWQYEVDTVIDTFTGTHPAAVRFAKEVVEARTALKADDVEGIETVLNMDNHTSWI